MIVLRSKREIELLRDAGKIVAETHETLKAHVVAGVTTQELDAIAESTIRKLGGEPAFKGYGGFPASICASVNSEVVHGIPGVRQLIEGDIISVDIGAIYKGYYGDSAKTHPVGHINDEAARLIDVTRTSFYESLKVCRVGFRLSDIGHTIQTFVESNGYSVVRDLVGHGVGTSMHEDPQIPNYGPPNKGPRLQAGMVLAIEPMVNQGTYHVETLLDNWTVVTVDRKLSAHYEHTLAITENDPIILTSLI